MILRIIIGIGTVLLSSLAAWFFFFQPSAVENSPDTPGFLNLGASQTVEVTPEQQGSGEGTPTNIPQTVQQKVFQVADGPVVSAIVMHTQQPTTTVARYVQQNNGHVLDLVLDSAGAVSKAVSNTTIPGVVRALWTKGGSGVILQYLDGNTVKTVSLAFPTKIATTSQPVTIKFLPDGIQDIVVSPNGTSVAYLLRTQTGVRGYSASTDGTGGKELFTLPFHEIVLTWPSQDTILAYTKSTLGTPSISFSISVSSGAVVTLLYAPTLTLSADPTYTYLVYQTSASGGIPTTYTRNLKTGQNSGLSFAPYPERCIWGTATSTMYCATPLDPVPANYLDLWHAGSATAAEALVSYSFPAGRSTILALPGDSVGGISSTIENISVSDDQKYLLFVRRGDKSLWGVRL